MRRGNHDALEYGKNMYTDTKRKMFFNFIKQQNKKYIPLPGTISSAQAWRLSSEIWWLKGFEYYINISLNFQQYLVIK